jgi:hypothetical protein
VTGILWTVWVSKFPVANAGKISYDVARYPRVEAKGNDEAGGF